MSLFVVRKVKHKNRWYIHFRLLNHRVPGTHTYSDAEKQKAVAEAKSWQALYDKIHPNITTEQNTEVA